VIQFQIGYNEHVDRDLGEDKEKLLQAGKTNM
jgi:hypothetical protein